jgi:hypothetical protein
VEGDLFHQSLAIEQSTYFAIEKGAQFDGRSKQERAQAAAKPNKKS